MAGEILGEAVAGLLKPLFRFIFEEVILHFLFEILVQGAGYYLCRPFNKNVKPDGFLVITVGFAFWLLFGMLVYQLFKA